MPRGGRKVADVKPALTPEEWSAKEYYRENSDQVKLCGKYLSVNNDESETCSLHDSEARHALAALALHEQPFGFTWDDLMVLYEAVRAAERAAPYGNELADQLRPIRDKIAALLPPRDTG
jgi:hypothetical protein